MKPTDIDNGTFRVSLSDPTSLFGQPTPKSYAKTRKIHYNKRMAQLAKSKLSEMLEVTQEMKY